MNKLNLLLHKNINYTKYTFPSNDNSCITIHLFGDMYGEGISSTTEMLDFVEMLLNKQYENIIHFSGNFSCIVETSSCTYIYSSITTQFPLYFMDINEQIYVSNSFKLLAEKFNLQPDTENIATMISGYDCLPYKEIHIFEVDVILSFSNKYGIKSLYRYNFPIQNYQDITFSECCSMTRKLVEKSVYNIAKYNNLGLALSGGIDSSILAICLKKLDVNFSCFHWTSFKYSVIDERKYVQDLSEKYKLNVHYIDIGENIEENNAYIDINERYDIPYNHSSYSWWSKMSIEAENKNVQNICTGYKADSLFSSTFSLLDRNDWKSKDKHWLFQYWFHSFSIINRSYYKNLNLESVNRFEKKMVCSADFVNPKLININIADNLVLKTHGTLIYQAESMKENIFQPKKIKIICPYCDRSLFEFSKCIQHFYKSIPIAGQILYKPLLRVAFEKDLPFSIFSRNSKSNFGFLAQKFCVYNKRFIEDLLLNNSILLELNVLLKDRLKNILDNEQLYKDSCYTLMRACFMEIWLRQQINVKETN